MHAVFDFSDIKRRAMFPENRPQDAGTPVIPPQFDDYGMYAGFREVGTYDGVPIFATDNIWPDTAPSEYCPPDFDPS